MSRELHNERPAKEDKEGINDHEEWEGGVVLSSVERRRLIIIIMGISGVSAKERDPQKLKYIGRFSADCSSIYATEFPKFGHTI